MTTKDQSLIAMKVLTAFYMFMGIPGFMLIALAIWSKIKWQK